VREQYAKSLAMDDKIGKAVEVWEELCHRNPANARYSEKLAECYFDRGWNKKAEVEVKRTLSLNPASITAWSLALHCIVAKMSSAPDRNAVFDEFKTAAQKAITAVKDVKENEWKKIDLYAHALISSPTKDRTITGRYLEEIAGLIRGGGRNGQNSGMNALMLIVESVPSFVLGYFYPEIQKIAALLPELATERGQGSSLKTKIENLRIDYEIENLEGKGFSDVFHDLFMRLHAEDEDDDDEIEITAMECEILEKKTTYDRELRRLREELPELYALHSAFFNEALRTRDPEKMLYQRDKKINKHNRKTGFFEEHPESAPEQPFRRAEPKIGRNDPCPCGSGKKYKKCCGA
jgi:uncharacterized protein YecA (UPF0149 family)